MVSEVSARATTSSPRRVAYVLLTLTSSATTSAIALSARLAGSSGEISELVFHADDALAGTRQKQKVRTASDQIDARLRHRPRIVGILGEFRAERDLHPDASFAGALDDALQRGGEHRMVPTRLARQAETEREVEIAEEDD